MERLDKLCGWYEAQCVDEWHEEYGIKISTLDNPGWSLKIDLTRTYLSEANFADVKRDTSDTNWIVARKNGEFFEAFGGPLNLAEMIDIFLAWAATSDRSIA